VWKLDHRVKAFKDKGRKPAFSSLFLDYCINTTRWNSWMPVPNVFCNLRPIPTSGDPRLGLSIQTAGHYHTAQHQVLSRITLEWVIIHCVEGKGSFRLGSHDWQISAGQIFLCPPDIVHTYIADPEEGWDIWWCHFNGTCAAGLLQLAGFSPETPCLLLDIKESPAILLRELVARLEQSDGHEGWDGAVLLYRFLAALGERHRGESWLEASIAPALSGKNFDNVDAMATACGLSRLRFLRRFKETMGISPWRWVLERRIAQAQTMLADPDMPVKTVARKLGYDDPDYFSRLFRSPHDRSRRW
jgi:AraC-like DNA-binding protein